MLKIEKRKLDDYDLINSKAIGDYCRQIEHKFNTKELAALVYRNRTMNIDEKIIKYQDLIDNYPDMEVIERINSKHYDSVKVMIQNEINRLKNTYEDFLKEDENSVYIWNEYVRTEMFYSRDEVVNNLKKTLNDVLKEIENYVNKYNDLKSLVITKKIFGEKVRVIYAYYNIINKIPKLIKIYDEDDEYLVHKYSDIDYIFVYMPTPFKKGDILKVENPSSINYGDNGEIFVLENLITWHKDIKEYLTKGKFNSSDMVGSGYYLYNEKWDYDCFEYYDDELVKNNRILKTISSYLKGEIDFEFLIYDYDKFRIESISKTIPDFYTKNDKQAGGIDINIYN